MYHCRSLLSVSVLPFAAPHQKFESQVPLDPFHRLSVLNSSAKVRCSADLSKASLNWPAANWSIVLLAKTRNSLLERLSRTFAPDWTMWSRTCAKRRETVAADANEIVGGEIQDQVAAVAFGDDEDIRPGPTLENVVAPEAVERLLAGTAGDDVVA